MSRRCGAAKRGRWISLALAACVASGELAAEVSPPAAGASAEEQNALKSLDAALARFETELATLTDVGQQARIEALLDGFKERADVLRQRFDQVRYDELRFDLNVEYQRLAQFLAPARTPRSDRTPPPLPSKQIADLGIVLVPIAAGTFMMGRSDPSPGSEADEKPETRVTLTRPFWLAATEVTVGQWRRFVEATGYRTEAEAADSTHRNKEPGPSWRNPGRPQTDADPVVGVTWNDAMKFCVWLTERERTADRLPAGHSYTLPTEAQWEYACRAGNHGPDPENLDAWSWHAGNSGRAPHRVGTKRPNVWGLFDMQGNVSEWCLDAYSAYPGGSVTDRSGPADGLARQHRGGSALSASGPGISSTRRSRAAASERRDDLGFRVALTANP